MIKTFIQYLVKHKLLVYFLFAVVTLAIFMITLAPSEYLGRSRIYQYDKLGHFALFFSWTFFYGFLSFTRRGADRTNILAIFLVGSFFGIGIEVLQWLMPFDRSLDVYDAVADVLGSLTAATLLKIVKVKYLS
jgi:VanZ family protein